MLNANDLAQDNPATLSRTPEQEAVVQTQKMQQELNLNKEQTQAIYEINLRHARERQVSNSRSQALERVKNKDAEVKQVLTRDQYNRLQEKKYDRYPSGSSSFQHNLPQTGTLQRRTVPAGNQRSESIQRRLAAPSERVGQSTLQRRAVHPSEGIDRRQAVPKSAQPVNPTRSVSPERRSAVPQTSSSSSQNRNSRPVVSPSRQSSKENGRPPARR